MSFNSTKGVTPSLFDIMRLDSDVISFNNNIFDNDMIFHLIMVFDNDML